MESWRHIPGDQNPADVASRGTTPLELLVDKLWQDGPKLSIDHSVPVEQSDLDVPLECLEELRAKEKRAVQGLLASETAKSGIGSLIEVQDFSDLNRLISILTLVLKFCSKLREKAGSMSFSGKERQYAELLLIRDAQESLKCHKNFTTWKRQFSFFKDDDGVLRCQGRIDDALSLPYLAKHPVILPSNSHLTTLYVHRAHTRVLHNGVKETLTELRSQFWVIRGRSVVKQILHNCHTCKRYEGWACRVPPPPPLPTFRVQEAPPFTNTGVDFACPLYIKNLGKVQSKAWIVLYTCCVTRAIHLELMSDMSAHTFIRSFKRFSSRRGLPALMISDNGKTFKAAVRIIKRVLSNPQVQKFFHGIGIEWRFNVPRAPWWGGLFERLVRSTKRCLRKVLGRSKFSNEELLNTPNLHVPRGN